jgi:hypothetical protein
VKQNVSSPISLASVTYLRARFLETAFGVDDAGPWTAVEQITLTNTAAPSPVTGEDGEWVANQLVDALFDAAGGGLSTLAEYQSPTAPAVTIEPSDAATSMSLTIRDNGPLYAPISTAAVVPTEAVALYRLLTSGGQRKISSGVTATIPMLPPGPTNLVVVQGTPGVAEIGVAWDNEAWGTDNLVLQWEDAVDPLAKSLGPQFAKSGPDDLLTGPQPGFPALAGIGATIRVRVLHYLGGGTPRYSLPTEDTVTLS